MKAVVRTAWGAVRRRRLQSWVIAAVVLFSSGTAVLALSLLVASSGPFDRAFTRQTGAHAVAGFDPAKASAADLAATATAAGVTGAAGPYDTVSAQLTTDRMPLPPALIAGRDAAAPAVDKLYLSEGSWLTGPGQIVLSSGILPRANPAPVGSTITVDVSGGPRLRVVGIADSITDSAEAWVWPTQSDVLHAAGTVASRQMLYRFAAADSDAAVRAGLERATAALPADAVSGMSTYRAVELRVTDALRPIVPFVVVFSLLGLIMSVLIEANVVAGAVVAGTRSIGLQKALGFTPGQVAAIFVGQVLLVSVPACVIGVGLGWLLATPVLIQTSAAYHIPSAGEIPAWTVLTVLIGVPVIVALAALGPALRAARMSAVQAITVGRAPGSGRGVRLRRLVASARLPRAVSFGLGTPLARPGRSAMTLCAVLIGATTIVFATGLAGSLVRVVELFDRATAVPVMVGFTPSGGAEPDRAAIREVIEAQPGTALAVGLSEVRANLAGSTEPVGIRGYDRDASRTGYPILSGRWYSGPDEAVAGSRMLSLTGTKVGDAVTVATQRGRLRVHIVGEVFTNGSGSVMVMSTGDLGELDGNLAPQWFEVELKPGTDPAGFVAAATAPLSQVGARPKLTTEAQENATVATMLGLIVALAVLISAVAALGVFNTVVLNTHERIYEIGVLKAIGMTPGQVRTTVVTSMVAVGAVAGALAVPLGWLLHRAVVPVMAASIGTGLPGSVFDVYHPLELVGLGLSGVVLSVVSALVPAGWAARSSAAVALRAE